MNFDIHHAGVQQSGQSEFPRGHRNDKFYGNGRISVVYGPISDL